MIHGIDNEKQNNNHVIGEFIRLVFRSKLRKEWCHQNSYRGGKRKIRQLIFPSGPRVAYISGPIRQPQQSFMRPAGTAHAHDLGCPLPLPFILLLNPIFRPYLLQCLLCFFCTAADPRNPRLHNFFIAYCRSG